MIDSIDRSINTMMISVNIDDTKHDRAHILVKKKQIMYYYDAVPDSLAKGGTIYIFSGITCIDTTCF